MIKGMINKHLYLLALEISPLDVGGVYDVLPSHCTLMHRFWSELNPGQLTNKLRDILDRANALPITYGEQEIFGPPPVTVNKILETPELKTLHVSLYERLDELGVEFTAPQWVGEGYKAHVTKREGVTFTEGESQLCKTVYLIEVNVPENKEARYIRAKFILKTD
jgi:2'-5' RNA ligase